MNPGQDLALETIQQFLHLYRHLRHYSRHMQEAGIRGRDFALLRFLLNDEKHTIGQIKKYMFLSFSTASEMISRLEQAGLVQRQRCKTDNRVVFVELTDAGRQIAEKTPMGGLPLLRERIKALPAEELAIVNQAVTILLETMEIDV